jgi:DNA mismatch endonuclease (patch repair protein)
MSRVRSRNTGPELRVRRAVWAEGFRYRLHKRGLPGTPDLVFSKYELAVFVHGCFWHQHGCPKSKRPSSNDEYWDRKLDSNIARDARARVALNALGWQSRTMWECRLESDLAELLSLLAEMRIDRCKKVRPSRDA